jgi:hypothetical protein
MDHDKSESETTLPRIKQVKLCASTRGTAIVA